MHPARPFFVPVFASILLAFFALAQSRLVAAAPTCPQETNDPYGLNCTYNQATGQPAPDTKPSIAEALGSVLNWLFGILGFIFLMLIVWGGIAWMTAGGNEERVNKAKIMINAAIAGLVVVFISFALAEAIIGALGVATGT